MDDNKNALFPPDSAKQRLRPLALISLLMKNIDNMHHEDEVFLWLSKALGQYLDMAVIQFWTVQLDNTGQLDAKIHAFVSQNLSLPQSLHVNHLVVSLIKHLFYEQRSTTSLAVEDIFSLSHTSLFTQNNLRYWTGYFLQNAVLLPVIRTEFVAQQASSQNNIIVSLFTQSPISPEQDRAISFTLKQAMRIMLNHDLLHLPGTDAAAAVATAKENTGQNDVFSAIIPWRSQDIEVSQGDNPFASASIIADKNARRLYTVVDGRKNIVELAHTIHLGQKEMVEALRYLFQQQKIDFYTSDGERVKQTSFLLSST